MSSQTRNYAAHGWRLVPVPKGRKGPVAAGWNTRERCITNPDAAESMRGNVGLAHCYSGTCAIDVDDAERAKVWLAAQGIDLDALLQSPDAVQITSGRPNRAKLLYALDRPLPSFKVAEGALELRCATSNGLTVHDLLPPSLHPDTGEPYRWVGDWSSLPPLPSQLLQLWNSLAEGKKAPGSTPPDRGTYTPASQVGTHQIREGGRNDYLTKEAGKLRRIGHDETVLLAALGQINHSRCNPPLADVELQQIARSVSRYAPAAEGALAEELNLRIGKSGVIIDEENVRRILSGDPELAGLVRFDEFRSERILTRPIPFEQGVIADRETPRPWRDSDTVALQTYIQRRIVPRIGRDKIEGVVDLHARERCAFHPVRDYLQSLNWDGSPRLDNWLARYLGANKQPERYLAAVGSRFMIAAVARIFQPGCQVDSAIVLEGAQGSSKSSSLRVLAGDEYFSDSLPADLSHKDARDHLRGKWIIELSELAQFKRGEVETIKAFLSRRNE